MHCEYRRRVRGDRRIGIARELTKLFEQVHVCRLEEAVVWLEQSENHRRGEFVLLVEGCPEPPVRRANPTHSVCLKSCYVSCR